MRSNKMIALLLFLLLLLIILCVRSHSGQIAEKRAILASKHTVLIPVNEVVTKPINYQLIKHQEAFELKGKFSKVSEVQQILSILKTNNLSGDTSINEHLSPNSKALELTQKLIPIFQTKYLDGSITLQDNKLSIEGTVNSISDKDNVSTLLANSTLETENKTKVRFVPTEPIKFKIEKKADLLAIQGVFSSDKNANKLIATLNNSDLRKHIVIDAKLIENRELLALTNSLIEPFKNTYTNGFIQYENKLLTVGGSVESQKAKDEIETLLQNSSIKYENNTQVMIPKPSAEELEILAEKKEAEAQKLAKEKAEAEAKKLAQKEAEEKARQAQAKKIEEKIKKVIDLENINFEVNKARLTEKSIKTISNIADILKEYPDVHIEIGGHTDNTGNEAYNLSLSQKRVERVRQSLISMDIDASRITAIGYGVTKPLVSNDTKENRRKNRRVEFKVKGE